MRRRPRPGPAGRVRRHLLGAAAFTVPRARCGACVTRPPSRWLSGDSNPPLLRDRPAATHRDPSATRRSGTGGEGAPARRAHAPRALRHAPCQRPRRRLRCQHMRVPAVPGVRASGRAPPARTTCPPSSPWSASTRPRPARGALTGQGPGQARPRPGSGGCSTDPGHRVVLAVLPGPNAHDGQAVGEQPVGLAVLGTDPLSVGAGQPAGHRRMVRRPPRAPAARGRGGAAGRGRGLRRGDRRRPRRRRGRRARGRAAALLRPDGLRAADHPADRGVATSSAGSWRPGSAAGWRSRCRGGPAASPAPPGRSPGSRRAQPPPRADQPAAGADQAGQPGGGGRPARRRR